MSHAGFSLKSSEFRRWALLGLVVCLPTEETEVVFEAAFPFLGEKLTIRAYLALFWFEGARGRSRLRALPGFGVLISEVLLRLERSGGRARVAAETSGVVASEVVVPLAGCCRRRGRGLVYLDLSLTTNLLLTLSVMVVKDLNHLAHFPVRVRLSGVRDLVFESERKFGVKPMPKGFIVPSDSRGEVGEF